MKKYMIAFKISDDMYHIRECIGSKKPFAVYVNRYCQVSVGYKTFRGCARKLEKMCDATPLDYPDNLIEWCKYGTAADIDSYIDSSTILDDMLRTNCEDCTFCEYLEKCRAGGKCECDKITEVYNPNLTRCKA